MPRLPKQPKPRDSRALRASWNTETTHARQARSNGDRVAEWTHLERAHILSQPLPAAHIRTHLAMLGFAIRQRDRGEIVGQLIRTIVAGPGSAIGRYPLGNTGGANVSAVAPMDIPDDLRHLLEAV
jgi:hypothetical protein